MCCQRGHLEVAKLLVENGANLEIKFKGLFTPLYVASDHGHVDIVRYLASVGADVDCAYTQRDFFAFVFYFF